MCDWKLLVQIELSTWRNWRQYTIHLLRGAKHVPSRIEQFKANWCLYPPLPWPFWKLFKHCTMVPNQFYLLEWMGKNSCLIIYNFIHAFFCFTQWPYSCWGTRREWEAYRWRLPGIRRSTLWSSCTSSITPCTPWHLENYRMCSV